MIIIDSSSIPDSFNILGEMKMPDISMEYFLCVFITEYTWWRLCDKWNYIFFLFPIFYFPIQTNLYF